VINPDKFKRLLDLLDAGDDPVFDDLFKAINNPDRDASMVHAALLPENVLQYKVDNTPGLRGLQERQGGYAARSAAQLEALGVYVWASLDFDSEAAAGLFEGLAKDIRHWHRSDEQREQDRFILDMIDAGVPDDLSTLPQTGDN
jgi:hypothetical protein